MGDHALPGGGSVSQSRQATGLSITLGGSSDRKTGAVCERPCWDCETRCESSGEAIHLKMIECRSSLLYIEGLYCSSVPLWRSSSSSVENYKRQAQSVGWIYIWDMNVPIDYKRQRSSCQVYNGPSKVKYEKTAFHSGSLSGSRGITRGPADQGPWRSHKVSQTFLIRGSRRDGGDLPS